MKHIIDQITLTIVKIDRRHVQLALLVITLGLFILGAGAPDGDGGLTVKSIIIFK